MMNKFRLMLSVDLDMWWHCRWATGGPNALWPSTEVLFKEYYGSERPGCELVSYTEQVLDLFDEYDVRATFFILGEVAGYFPDLIRRIHRRGHEIACHGMRHVDATELGPDIFRMQVDRAKKMLEDLVGEAVTGFRAPNLVLPNWIYRAIFDLNFSYDSSICPSRTFFGKYGGLAAMPHHPFLLRFEDSSTGILPEIPIAIMPWLRLPAGVGIITRAIGGWWSRMAIAGCLHRGDTMYYFHPYEIGDPPKLSTPRLYVRLFLRNIGGSYRKTLRRLLGRYRYNDWRTASEIAAELRESVNYDSTFSIPSYDTAA